MTVVRVHHMHDSLHVTALVTCHWLVETHPPNKMRPFSPELLDHLAPQ